MCCDCLGEEDWVVSIYRPKHIINGRTRLHNDHVMGLGEFLLRQFARHLQTSELRILSLRVHAYKGLGLRVQGLGFNVHGSKV